MTGAGHADMADFLDALCPMHVVLDAEGRVVHAGPTARKVLGDGALIGTAYCDLFEVRRPVLAPGPAALRAVQGQRLHCVLRAPPHTELKGVALALPEGQAPGLAGGMVVALSFGIGLMDAVGRHGLTGSDFAVTDLAVEMLYLAEAKDMVADAWQTLNQRLQGAKAEAEKEAHTDTLTGLRNRRALEPVLHRLIARDVAFTLMHLDLDYFKSVNDTLGHAAGDLVLRRVARILRDETREGDTVIRVGGDEFVLILAQELSGRDLSDISARLIQRLEEPIRVNGEVARISGSIGTTASVNYAVPRIAVMMDDADLALYAAKEAGRRCHVAFTAELRAAVQSRSGEAVARA